MSIEPHPKIVGMLTPQQNKEFFEAFRSQLAAKGEINPIEVDLEKHNRFLKACKLPPYIPLNLS